MGRRAKNKQGDPTPLVDANAQGARPSAKKLGKRKADAEDDAREVVSKRPAKKMKEDVKKGEKKGTAKKQAPKKGAAPKASKKVEESEDEELDEDEVMESGSSEGWEDVEDADIEAEAKCVYRLYRPLQVADSNPQRMQVIIPRQR